MLGSTRIELGEAIAGVEPHAEHLERRRVGDARPDLGRQRLVRVPSAGETRRGLAVDDVDRVQRDRLQRLRAVRVVGVEAELDAGEPDRGVLRHQPGVGHEHRPEELTDTHLLVHREHVAAHEYEVVQLVEPAELGLLRIAQLAPEVEVELDAEGLER